MKNYLKTLFLLIAISFFSVSCMQANEPDAKERSLAVDFKLSDLNQNTVTLSNFKDKQPVILFFWTTWCLFCRKELKTLKDMYPGLKEEGWELFAVDVGEPLYRVENFTQSYFLNFRVLLDKDAAVAQAYGILGVPTYILINKEGYIVFVGNYFPHKNYKELILRAN